MHLNRIEDWDKILQPLNVAFNNLSKPVQKLDRNLASKAARSDDYWHDNMLRLTSSWVAKGNTDEEIHVLAATHILPGYSPDETRYEIQKMIDGARNKGFAPQTDKADTDRPPLLEHIATIKLTAPQYLIEGLIEQRSVCQIFGKPGTGKSFMAIDVACSIASGKDFHGRPVVLGPVVYVAGEGRRGVVRRVNAWAKANSIKLSDMSLYLSRTAVGINNGNNLAKLKAEIRSISEEFGSPALIILDTLARNFGDGDENDTRDMTRFIAELDRLNDEFNCTSLMVHHSGHGENSRARGSSALKGALDAEYKISKQNDRINMSCTKMKDEDEPDPLLFYLIPVDLGKDQNGKPVGSAVLEFRGTATPESARLTENERLGVTTFNEAFAELEHSTLDLNPAQLHLEQWREIFYKRATQPKTDSKRTAFDRARRTLRDKGWITVEDDVYTLTPRTPGQSPDKQD